MTGFASGLPTTFSSQALLLLQGSFLPFLLASSSCLPTTLSSQVLLLQVQESLLLVQVQAQALLQGSFLPSESVSDFPWYSS